MDQLSDSLGSHGLQQIRPPCPSPTTGTYSNSIHCVGDAIQPSHPLLSPSPPTFNLSQHQGLFQWVSSSIRWPNYWSFSFSISPSNEHSGLISFRIEWLDLLAVQGTLKSLLHTIVQSINSLVLNWLYSPTLTSIHVWKNYSYYRKTIDLTRRTFAGKVMSLLFNMLSMMVIAFLPKSVF